MGDTAHGFHRARRNHHTFGAKRSAGDARADVIDVMNHIGHRFDVFHGIRSLHLNRHLARFAQDQMRFDIVDAWRGSPACARRKSPRGAGDTDDQSFFVIQLRNSNVSGRRLLRRDALSSRTRRNDFDFVLWIILHLRKQNCSATGFTRPRSRRPLDFESIEPRATKPAVRRRQRYAGQFSLRSAPKSAASSAPLGRTLSVAGKGE